MNQNHEIDTYLSEIDKIYRSGKGTEHSYRPALKTLFEAITSGLTITNEPKRIACGAPDYIITRNDIPIGYIEAKDISVGIYNKANKEQFDRYKQSLNNLIITDYLSFQLFVDGAEVVTITIAKESGGGIAPDKKQCDAFMELVQQFTDFRGKSIYQSEQLAKMMAAKAKLLAGIIEKALHDTEAENDTLSGQLEGFRKILIHDLSIPAFADMYAQTLVYGMFAARLNDHTNDKFSRLKAAALIPPSNPFLRRFFYYIAGPDLDDRICWIVDALADIFNCVAVEVLFEEFGRANQDPYLHFYETFLAEYNHKLREERGVYYTPLPIVKFIVQAVDTILQNDFHIAKGLADSSKDEGFHKVYILEPATGTGTFLVEVIENIYKRFVNQKGMWRDYCKEHLLPRLNGFEILMAPYAMAHFKLEMKLKETGINTAELKDRFRVYLTNSLETAADNNPVLLMEKWLSDEADEANRVKRDAPVMVVLGNPPYSGESANKNCLVDLLEDYKKEPGGIERLQEKNSKWLNDDYVKFIRYGQSLVVKNGSGILAYVNNHSFLDNPTFRGMRWNLLQTFDKIYILDIHGNVKKKESAPDGSKDENIFNIQQGVSINIFVKTKKKKQDEYAKLYHYDLYGSRKAKYTYLLENTLTTVKWVELSPNTPQYFFVEKDFTNQAEYEEGFSVQKLFPVNSVGIVTARDDFTIHNSVQSVKNIIKEFLSLDDETVRQRFNLGKDVRDWSVAGARKDLVPADFSHIVKINYRPFDIRYTYYTGHSKGFHCMPRGEVMRHFLAGNNNGLVIGRQGQVVGSMPWNLAFVTSQAIDFNLYYRGGGYIFPLYLYPESDNLDSTAQRRPNLNKNIVDEIAQQTGLRFTEEKEDGDATFSPLDLLDYIYAVLYSNNYRAKYKEFLKIDFPRVPYPENKEPFQKLSKYGAALRNLHLLENVEPLMDMALYPIEGNNCIDKIVYKNGNVYINKTQYFENVPLEVWEYYIGGYQPAQKWLKDRKERELDYDDISHYQKIITALSLTIEVQAHIDTILK
ncbi:MAG: N-6 DNA methylase [Treponema sp.]|jgi:predicted helicase|nr:N-6 DNA methylase [Treponema sp.]